jgi:hypothetical protein
MYQIVTVSQNTPLLLGRNDTLVLAGFRVISPCTPERAPYLAFERKADVVIFGHSVEPDVRRTAIEVLRKLCPECTIVFVYTGPKQQEPLGGPIWM